LAKPDHLTANRHVVHGRQGIERFTHGPAAAPWCLCPQGSQASS
jgi:hypothetical protein